MEKEWNANSDVEQDYSYEEFNPGECFDLLPDDIVVREIKKVPEGGYCFYIKDLINAKKFSGGFVIKKSIICSGNSIKLLGTVIDVAYRNNNKVVYTVQDDSGAIDCYEEPQDLLEKAKIENKIKEIRTTPRTETYEMQIMTLTSAISLINKRNNFLLGDVIEVIGNLREYNYKSIFISKVQKVTDLKYRIKFLENLSFLYNEVYPTFKCLPYRDKENEVILEDTESEEDEED